MGKTVDEFMAEFDGKDEDWDIERNLDLVMRGVAFLIAQADEQTWPSGVYRGFFFVIRKCLIDAEEQYFPPELSPPSGPPEGN